MSIGPSSPSRPLRPLREAESPPIPEIHPTAEFGVNEANLKKTKSAAIQRQHRQNKGFGEDIGRLERPTKTKEEKADQTQPTGPVRLSGVEPRDTEQSKDWHGGLEGSDDDECAGIERWMGWLNCQSNQAVPAA